MRQVLSGTADGQSQVVARIAEPAGAAGWFRPGDAIWTVHGSVATFLGGIRSLLLQSLHPLALAGVERHSRYREDPFGRLQRTGAFIAATTFGPVETAEQTTSAIRAMHATVRGTATDGRSYSAQDPRLLMWVHVTLVDSMLAAYDLYGRHGAVDRDGYVADMALVGERMGVVNPPRDADALAEELESFRPELQRSPASDDMVGFVRKAPLPRGLRLGYSVLVRGAVASLPDWAHPLMGQRTPGPVASKVDRSAAGMVLRVLSMALVKSPAQAAGERRLQISPDHINRA